MNVDEIPGWFDFADIYDRAVDEAPRAGALFVEVGVYYGKSTCYMAERIRSSGKVIMFDAVDCFGDASAPLQANGPDALHPPAQISGPAAFHENATALGVRELVNLIVLEQLEAAAAYADDSIDFVFIDSDHDYEATRAAIAAFLPKVKPYGVIAGHDWIPTFPGVDRAVREAFGDCAVRIGSSFWWRKGAS